MHLFHIMDTAIDLSDESKALDLANIRFQLMYVVISVPLRPVVAMN